MLQFITKTINSSQKYIRILSDSTHPERQARRGMDGLAGIIRLSGQFASHKYIDQVDRKCLQICLRSASRAASVGAAASHLA